MGKCRIPNEAGKPEEIFVPREAGVPEEADGQEKTSAILRTGGSGENGGSEEAFVPRESPARDGFYAPEESRCFRLLLLGGLFACLGIAVASLCLGSIRFSPLALIRMLAGGGDRVARSILIYARLPRTLAALASGAALSVSGAVLQNVLDNKLASPGIIGVNAGAGLGVTLCLAAGTFSGFPVSCAAFSGSLVTVLMIFLFSYRMNASKTTVILGGVALNAVWNAIAESVTVLDADVGMLSMDFRVGGFSAVSYPRLVPAAVLILAALFVLLTLCSELDITALGDETAMGLGLPVARYRMLFLALAALLSGAAVSFSGLLGFVGLIVPHFVRRFSGSGSGRLLPACAVCGAGFVLLCDLVSRLLFLPYELPVGILMSVAGGPVFLWMLVRKKRGAL